MTSSAWLFEAIDQHEPGSTAIEGPDERVSYAQLSARARVRAYQFRLRLGRTRTVVVIAERGRPDTLLTLLALWSDGRVPLLLAHDTPPDRIAAVVSALRPAGVIHDGAMVTSNTDGDDNGLAGCPDPAYFVMTSGSTREPRLVLCRWRGLELVARQLMQRYRMSPASRVLQFASPVYDAYLAETVPVLLAGGTVVCCDNSEWTTPRRLAQAISSRQVTHATFPPSYLKRLLMQPGLPRLKVTVSAGEALDASLATAARRHSELLINAYGPCETTICATTYEVRGGEAEIPLGTPLQGVDVIVTDRLLRISGPTVAWGYVANQSSAGGFIVLPDGRDAFVPGDLCIVRDGCLLYRGRNDRQQKVLGHRIDLAAVEHAINSIPLVRDCAVVMLNHEMVAVVVTCGDVADIERAAREVLPVRERPRHWRAVAAIPYLASDKLDLTSVLRLFDNPPDATNTPTIHKDVAEAWSRHVPLSNGAETDFFSEGGDSLQAMALLDDVYSTTGADLDLADFITEPTFGNLIRLIGR